MTNKIDSNYPNVIIYLYNYFIPSQFLLPSLKPKYITSPNETLKCV